MTTQTTDKTIADLTVAELREMIREAVAEAVAELVEDSDEGLELSDWAAARLEAAQVAEDGGERRTTPLTEVISRRGLSE